MREEIEIRRDASYREGFDYGFIEGGRNALKALSDYISKETPPIIIETGEKQIQTLQAENAKLKAKLEVAEKALEPFTHEDLSFKFSNNCQGNESIIFQRNNAILTIGDIKRAQEALTDIKALQGEEGE